MNTGIPYRVSTAQQLTVPMHCPIHCKLGEAYVPSLVGQAISDVLAFPMAKSCAMLQLAA